MNFGVFLTTGQLPPLTQEEVFENSIVYAQEAERLGFSGAWVLEHHFTRYGLCSSPLTMAAFLLGRTQTLRVGTAVSVLPLYHPVQLAEQVAIIDQLSDGRLDFGIGRGLFAKDFDVFGVSPDQSHELMREWSDIIVSAWTEDVVGAQSEHIQFNPVPVYPTPRTRPRPPMYVVCESPGTTEWVAAKGYPMMMSWWLEREAMRSQVELYESVAQAYGHNPKGVKHVLSCIAHVGDTREEARDAVRENLSWWRRVGREAMLKFEELQKLPNYAAIARRWEDRLLSGEGDVDSAEREADERLLDLNLIGTAEECLETLEGLVEATGVEHIICGFEAAGSQENTLAAMERFEKEVMAVAGKTAERV
jgi:alkanal monooxygenase alpha chain